MPAIATLRTSILRPHASSMSKMGVLAFACSWVVGAGVAFAHDAMPTAAKPDGWSYPFSCCSGYDCRMVPEAAISERPEGYVIDGTGEVVGYRDARLKDSPDGEFHWCSVAGAEDGRTICLFVPPRSY
jgi:hypothetical protein